MADTYRCPALARIVSNLSKLLHVIISHCHNYCDNRIKIRMANIMIWKVMMMIRGDHSVQIQITHLTKSLLLGMGKVEIVFRCYVATMSQIGLINIPQIRSTQEIMWILHSFLSFYLTYTSISSLLTRCIDFRFTNNSPSIRVTCTSITKHEVGRATN